MERSDSPGTTAQGEEAHDMCMTCGCGQPNDQHGNDAHITYDQLQAAASAAGIETEEAADNLHDLAKTLRDEGTAPS